MSGAHQQMIKDFCKLIEKNEWTRGAEIGVCKGKFTAYVVKRTGIHMIAVDLWANSDQIDPEYNTYTHEKNYQTFINHLGQYRDRVTIYQMLSWEAANLVEDWSLDFVFIDASHDFESVWKDIIAWKRKAKYLIAGHDYDRKGVSQAVNALLKPITLGMDNSWYYYVVDKDRRSFC